MCGEQIYMLLFPYSIFPSISPCLLGMYEWQGCTWWRSWPHRNEAIHISVAKYPIKAECCSSVKDQRNFLWLNGKDFVACASYKSSPYHPAKRSHATPPFCILEASYHFTSCFDLKWFPWLMKQTKFSNVCIVLVLTIRRSARRLKHIYSFSGTLCVE